MKKEEKLVLVKLGHTAIWLAFNVLIFYMYYSVFTNNINIWLWIGFGLILLEGLVLLLFRMACPLTLVARKYSGSTRPNFDIFLPQWLAKNNKLIYTSLVVFLIIILIVRKYV